MKVSMTVHNFYLASSAQEHEMKENYKTEQ